MFTRFAHPFLLDASHALLDHEGVHIDIRLKSAAVGRVGKTVINESLLAFKDLFLLSQHLMEALNILPFQIELLLDVFDTRLILLKQDVELVHVHLSDRAIVVGLIGVNAAMAGRYQAFG